MHTRFRAARLSCAGVLPSCIRRCHTEPAREQAFAQFSRPLSDLLGATLNERFAQQGFASRELITRWADIAGADIAAHCEPTSIQWPRAQGDEDPEPATLVLRVEGPSALEIQHLSAVILERVNRFFGWQAIGRIALRQAPLRRRDKPTPPTGSGAGGGGANCRGAAADYGR